MKTTPEQQQRARAALAPQAVTPTDLERRSASLEEGFARRRQMLGDAWVQKAIDGRNAFNGEFQDFITRTAWGEVWRRPGLPPKTRRLMVVASLVGLGAWEELELHLRAGLSATDDSALTPDDVKEALLQAAVYCGVPKANHAFKLAERLIEAQAQAFESP